MAQEWNSVLSQISQIEITHEQEKMTSTFFTITCIRDISSWTNELKFMQFARSLL